MTKFIYIFRILSFVLIFWSKLGVAQEMTPSGLTILLSRDASFRDELKSRKKTWKTICGAFGRALELGKGPWGFGIFSSHSCSEEKIGKKNTPLGWVLEVRPGDADLVLTLRMNDQEIATTSIKRSPYLVSYLSDDEFVDQLIVSLLDRAPFTLQVTRAMVKGDPPSFEGRYFRSGLAPKHKFKVPEPPKDLILYRLFWNEDDKTFKSEVVGQATLLSSEAKEVLQKGRKKGKAGYAPITYKVTPEILAALDRGPLWAHSAAGPGEREKEIKELITASNDLFIKAGEDDYLNEFSRGKSGVLKHILRTAASGYVGMRYGLQVLPTQGDLGRLLAKTSVFNLLVEIRGGPVKGLRYYYDKVAEQKLSVNMINGATSGTRIGFARHVLGYSFGWELPFLFNRITADPKIGMWNVSAQLPVAQDDLNQVVAVEDFDLGRTFSVAMEVGLERALKWFTLRGWYSIDTGFSLLKSGGKITSNRLGIDSYVKVGPVFSLFKARFAAALLGFYQYEGVSITKGSVPNPDAGDAAISAINYSLGYAGAGIALSW